MKSQSSFEAMNAVFQRRNTPAVQFPTDYELERFDVTRVFDPSTQIAPEVAFGLLQDLLRTVGTPAEFAYLLPRLLQSWQSASPDLIVAFGEELLDALQRNHFMEQHLDERERRSVLRFTCDFLEDLVASYEEREVNLWRLSQLVNDLACVSTLWGSLIEALWNFDRREQVNHWALNVGVVFCVSPEITRHFYPSYDEWHTDFLNRPNRQWLPANRARLILELSPEALASRGIAARKIVGAQSQQTALDELLSAVEGKSAEWFVNYSMD